jgi:hypothetical protein
MADEEGGEPSVESGLPQAVPPYVDGARKMTQQQFVAQCPHPFLFFPRSTLWDPLLLRLQASSGGGDTKIVSYNVQAGGYPFICPIRKRRQDGEKAIFLGRSSKVNDMVVPVASVSSKHACFYPPDPAAGRKNWIVIDLGSSNGTFVEEQGIEPKKPVLIQNAQSMRYGGNLVAWFFENTGLYDVLIENKKLEYYMSY